MLKWLKDKHKTKQNKTFLSNGNKLYMSTNNVPCDLQKRSSNILAWINNTEISQQLVGVYAKSFEWKHESLK